MNTLKSVGVRALVGPNGPTAPVVPSPGTPQGGRWRKVLSQQLIYNTTPDSGPANNPQPALFIIDNPSARLHLKCAVVAEWPRNPTFQLPQSGAGAWYLHLDAWDKKDDGVPLQSNVIVDKLPLPTSYDAITMNDQWRGIVTLPAVDAGAPQGGVLYVIAAWEPAPGWNGDDRQLAQLFQACNLSMRGITGLSV
jgi:hypothetical protein